MTTPFSPGTPIPPEHFIGRKKEIRRLAGRVLSQGQCAALVGEPRVGKTSLLGFLLSQPRAGTEDPTRLTVSYLDGHTFGTSFTSRRFWELAFNPLAEGLAALDGETALKEAYQRCVENGFETFTVKQLLDRMATERRRLVLAVDEFDLLVECPMDNAAGFFGGLRSLASLSQGTLALLIASRRSVNDLNTATQPFNRMGSPYFNVFAETTLGPLSDDSIAGLLARAGDRFNKADRRLLTLSTGGHPYLLQAGAAALWEVYEDGVKNATQRRETAARELLDAATATLQNTWHHWNSHTRMAFTAVGLAQLPTMVDHHDFDVTTLLHDLRDLGPELRELEKRGFIAPSDRIPGGWKIRPMVFLWWLADELLRTVRTPHSFEEWIRAQEWDGLLKKQEVETLGQSVTALLGLFREGASTLIQAVARGVGESLGR